MTTVLVTGATSGLGRAVAHRLAEHGARVLVHGRDAQKASETRAELVAATGNDEIEVVIADLAELRQVRDLAAQVGVVDVLINNAGVGTGRPEWPRAESKDGIELRFAVNYLAGYHLVHSLRHPPTRIVNVSSVGQAPIDFADPMSTGNYSHFTAYCRSKLAQIMMTFDLAEALRGKSTVNALHPGTYMDTQMIRESGIKPTGSLEAGAEATFRLAVDPRFGEVTGQYFDVLEMSPAHPQAYDTQARQLLRTLSDSLIGER